MASEAPLGLLGGTFDPIHHGHLRLAEEALERLQLDQVRLIPAGHPAHRGQPAAAATHRLRMAELAAAGNPAFEIDPAEVHSTAPSYTVPTLERLRRELGTTRPLVLLLGADAFAGLASWHRWERLFELAHIGVATRPGHTVAAEQLPAALAAEWLSRQANPAALRQAPAGLILPFSITALDISATAIRAMIGAGTSPRYLLPDPVVDYIGLHHLYSAKEPLNP